MREKVIQQDLYYKNQMMISYSIQYPQFISARFSYFLDKLNSFYRTKAQMYEKNEVKKLFQLAMVEYEYAIAHDFPFRPFEAILSNQVTYNKNCAISVYFDTYEYTGGAHGSTRRSADSWNLQRGVKINLDDIILVEGDLQPYVEEEIIKQIEPQAQGENFPFFEDYKTLVNQTLKLQNFYLTDQGVEIFFQQYDIAPYASGLPTFLIAYEPGIVVQPQCF